MTLHSKKFFTQFPAAHPQKTFCANFNFLVRACLLIKANLNGNVADAKDV